MKELKITSHAEQIQVQKIKVLQSGVFVSMSIPDSPSVTFTQLLKTRFIVDVD